jgi:hypothetical protein
MKKYISIYKEASKQINKYEFNPLNKKSLNKNIDISNLVWSKDKGFFNWYDAKKLEKNGWRLPTIQELATAKRMGIKGFEEMYGLATYWSGSTVSTTKDSAWYYHGYHDTIEFNLKKIENFVRLVKEKK